MNRFVAFPKVSPEEQPISLRIPKCCDIRCECGSLMAKRTPAGIEIKCRRCKRIQLVLAMPPDEEFPLK
jgi:hypothetical protein